MQGACRLNMHRNGDAFPFWPREGHQEIVADRPVKNSRLPEGRGNEPPLSSARLVRRPFDLKATWRLRKDFDFTIDLVAQFTFRNFQIIANL